MTKRDDVDSQKWATSIRGAQNAIQVIQEIREGGPVIEEIRASLEKARKLQREHFRRERRIALDVEMNRRRFRFPVEHRLGDSRVHPWAPHLQMLT